MAKRTNRNNQRRNHDCWNVPKMLGMSGGGNVGVKGAGTFLEVRE